MAEPVRLSRHVAELRGCSRREAEWLIEGGGVRVNGAVVDRPGAKVSARDTVVLAPDARAEPVAPVTVLLHKPPGAATDDAGPAPALQCVVLERHDSGDRSGIRFVHRHTVQQPCVTPLETGASGLVVFSQDRRVQRKLEEDAGLIEHETMVEVAGPVSDDALRLLNRPPVVDGRAMLAGKVSISRSNDTATGLRFALKGHWPGQIAQMCDAAQLRITAMKRIRIGRVAMAGLAPGQWRYLMPYERF